MTENIYTLNVTWTCVFICFLYYSKYILMKRIFEWNLCSTLSRSPDLTTSTFHFSAIYSWNHLYITLPPPLRQPPLSRSAPVTLFLTNPWIIVVLRDATRYYLLDRKRFLSQGVLNWQIFLSVLFHIKNIAKDLKLEFRPIYQLDTWEQVERMVS